MDVFGDVEISLVERERFDDRRVLGEYRADLLADRLVDLEARLDEDQVRTLPARSNGRHLRPDIKFAGFVAGSGHDATLPLSADGNGLAAQPRIVALLHGGIECIHVDMDDLSLDDGNAPVGRDFRSVILVSSFGLHPKSSYLKAVVWRRRG